MPMSTPFVITIRAIGPNGCQRERGDGELVDGCGRPDCADCAGRRCIADLRGIGGMQIASARIEHVIGEHTVGDQPVLDLVTDDMISQRRSGAFADKADAAVVAAATSAEVARVQAEADARLAEVQGQAAADRTRAEAAEAELAKLKAQASPPAEVAPAEAGPGGK